MLHILYSNTTEIMICGDLNINYLNDSSSKHSLDLILASYGLSSIVNLPSRIQKNSYSAIDNIFINTLNFNTFSVYPIINGLSDHDAQGLIIHNMLPQKYNSSYSYVRLEVFTAVTMKNGVFWDVLTRATWRNIPEDTILHSYSYIQKFDEPSIRDFNMKLSYELWEAIFGGKHVNTAPKSFFKYLLKNILF
jgi:hypothetical protein